MSGAEQNWNRIKALHGDLLSGYEHQISQTDISGKGRFYRLRLSGFEGNKDANQTCSKLQNLGLDCFVVVMRGNAAASTASAPTMSNQVYGLKLSTTRTEENARQARANINMQYSDDLADWSPHIQTVTSSDGRILFELRIGEFENREQAISLCEKLRSAGQDCLPFALSENSPQKRSAQSVALHAQSSPPPNAKKRSDEEPGLKVVESRNSSTTKSAKPVAGKNIEFGHESVTSDVRDLPTVQTSSPDKFRADPVPTKKIGKRLTVGGYYEVEYKHRHNYDLDTSEDDELGILETELQLLFGYVHDNNFSTVLGLQGSRDLDIFDDNDRHSNDWRAGVARAYADFSLSEQGTLLRIGRQRFEDEREWLFDDTLDAVSATVIYDDISFSGFFGREGLFPENLVEDNRGDEVNYYFLSGGYALTSDAFAKAYMFHTNNLSDDRKTTYWGLRSMGEIDNRLTYWLDTALARGSDEDDDIRAYAFDAGGSFTMLPAYNIYAIGGFAMGSGDSDRNDSRDTTYRQSGLEGNEAKSGGIVGYNYYGELFDPELSNIKIWTLGLGIKPSPRFSADLVFHKYEQHHQRDRDRADVRPRPNGDSKELGWESDLVMALRVGDDARATMILGYFAPGDAYEPDTDDAMFLNLSFRRKF